MVAHWRRHPGPGSRGALVLTLVGALATGATAVVVVVSRFAEGAWAAAAVLALLVGLFGRIHRHYQVVARQLVDEGPLDVTGADPPMVVVPVSSWNQLTSRALRFALELSPEVHAVHVLTDGSTISELSELWERRVADPARQAGLQPPQLVLQRSSYRQFFGPLIEYVETLRDDNPGRDIVVIVPDLVVSRWYQTILHNNRGAWLRTLLRLRGGPRIVVVSMPFHLVDRPR
jgi:hypothetical protein